MSLNSLSSSVNMLNTPFISITKLTQNKGKGRKMAEKESESEEMVEQDPSMEKQNNGKETLMGGNSEEGIGEASTNSTKESSPILLFGFIINPAKGKQKAGYSCDICHKTFLTPQALGGHQNGHKWERDLKRGIQTINDIARRRESYPEFSIPSSPIPQFQFHLDRMIQQHVGTTNSDKGILHGTSEFQHPNQVTWFNNPWFNETNKNNNNINGMHPLIGELKEALQQEQGQNSRLDFVPQPEIDFGLVSKGGADDYEQELDTENSTQQDEAASKIDLTLKL